MKKTLALIAILILSAGVIFGEYTDPKTLNIYGKILAGDISFEVTQSQTSPVNLKTEASVQADGAGYTIGSWTFSAYNQGTAKSYSLKYDYAPLSLSGENQIGILLIEKVGAISTEIADEGTSAISAIVGNTSITRSVAFRLTTDGVIAVASAPASENYSTTVTLTVSAL